MTNPHDKAIEAAADAVKRCLTAIGVDATGNTCSAIAQAAIAAYERAMWRPIEEAPKDGTQIIAYGPGRYKPFYVGTTAWSEGWIGKWPIAYMGYAAGEPTLFRICPLPPVPEGE